MESMDWLDVVLVQLGHSAMLALVGLLLVDLQMYHLRKQPCHVIKTKIVAPPLFKRTSRPTNLKIRPTSSSALALYMYVLVSRRVFFQH